MDQTDHLRGISLAGWSDDGCRWLTFPWAESAQQRSVNRRRTRQKGSVQGPRVTRPRGIAHLVSLVSLDKIAHHECHWKLLALLDAHFAWAGIDPLLEVTSPFSGWTRQTCCLALPLDLVPIRVAAAHQPADPAERARQFLLRQPSSATISLGRATGLALGRSAFPLPPRSFLLGLLVLIDEPGLEAGLWFARPARFLPASVGAAYDVPLLRVTNDGLLVVPFPHPEQVQTALLSVRVDLERSTRPKRALVHLVVIEQTLVDLTLLRWGLERGRSSDRFPAGVKLRRERC